MNATKKLEEQQVVTVVLLEVEQFLTLHNVPESVQSFDASGKDIAYFANISAKAKQVCLDRMVWLGICSLIIINIQNMPLVPKTP